MNDKCIPWVFFWMLFPPKTNCKVGLCIFALDTEETSGSRAKMHRPMDIFDSQRRSLGLLKFSKVLEFGDPFGVRSLKFEVSHSERTVTVRLGWENLHF